MIVIYTADGIGESEKELLIINSNFQENTRLFGGASVITSYYNWVISITQSTIENNYAVNSGEAINCYQSSISFTNSTFQDNFIINNEYEKLSTNNYQCTGCNIKNLDDNVIYCSSGFNYETDDDDSNFLSEFFIDVSTAIFIIVSLLAISAVIAYFGIYIRHQMKLKQLHENSAQDYSSL